ncbi:MAG: DUF433 domain-containing protein [Gammaproteobacteria bacterium]|nr:DUF433 domain-containing protein [Gammaproteobacteria bacterium]
MSDELIERNPKILCGAPVFSGTRVPVQILMDHLEAGDCLDDFLDDYPTVSRGQAIELLERARMILVGDVNCQSERSGGVTSSRTDSRELQSNAP